MNTWRIFMFALLIGNVSFASDGCEGNNSQPMFGYNANHKENSCDKAFIVEILKSSGGDRTRAVKTVSQLGYQALQKSDPLVAIKRFNQAWLLDRKNPKTFWDFGVWEQVQRNYGKSEEFLKKAIKDIPKPTPSGLQVDFARTLASQGKKIGNKELLNEADKLYSLVISADPTFFMAYVNRAFLMYDIENYAEAWNMADKAEALKPGSVQSGFISALEKKKSRSEK